MENREAVAVVADEIVEEAVRVSPCIFHPEGQNPDFRIAPGSVRSCENVFVSYNTQIRHVSRHPSLQGINVRAALALTIGIIDWCTPSNFSRLTDILGYDCKPTIAMLIYEYRRRMWLSGGKCRVLDIYTVDYSTCHNLVQSCNSLEYTHGWNYHISKADLAYLEHTIGPILKEVLELDSTPCVSAVRRVPTVDEERKRDEQNEKKAIAAAKATAKKAKETAKTAKATAKKAKVVREYATKKSFEQRIEELKAYKTKHGHVNVKKGEDKSLHGFFYNVRYTRKNISRTRP